MRAVLEFAVDRRAYDTQRSPVDGIESAPGQAPPDTQGMAARSLKLVADQSTLETHIAYVRDMESDSGQRVIANHATPAGVLATDPQSGTTVSPQSTAGAFLALRIWSEMYYDAQKARCACENRAERGGVDPAPYAVQLKAMMTAEHQMKLAMGKEYRRVCPMAIREWQVNSRGIGEHLTARLLGCIGHPRHATPHHWEGTGETRVLIAEEPMERRVSDLWSYCGHGDATRRKRKGQSPEEVAATGNPVAKMLVHLLAEACMKAGGPYRDAYDLRRAATALAHFDWTKGHSHNDALRIIGKTILKDLWIAGGLS